MKKTYYSPSTKSVTMRTEHLMGLTASGQKDPTVTRQEKEEQDLWEDAD